MSRKVNLMPALLRSVATVVESPNAQLRREMGWAQSISHSIRVGDWMKLNCGDIVREKDGRHTGRVEAIGNFIVKVRWDDTGWFSWIHRDDLERVTS
jgi:hypothetical protein